MQTAQRTTVGGEKMYNTLSTDERDTESLAAFKKRIFKDLLNS